MEFPVHDVKALGNFYLNTLEKIGLKPKFSRYNLDMFICRYGFNHVPIAIIGSNPSQSSPDNTPFHKSTKSRQTIDSWFNNVDFDYRMDFYNIVGYKTHNNSKLSQRDISQHLPKIKDRFTSIARTRFLVAVGSDAQRALDAAGVEHFKMPHPSGLNRFWNNKEAGEAKIQEMIEWLKNSHSQRVKEYRDLAANPT